MAKKRSGGGPLVFSIAAVAAAAIGGGVFWMSRSAGAGASATPPAAPALPEGSLAFAGTGVTEARYVVSDGLKAGGAATVLVVGKTATAIEQRYPLAVKQELVDCANRTIGQEMVSFYDQDGKRLTSQYETGPAGRPAESADSEVPLVCDHAQTPTWRARSGWRAAQRDIQAPPADIDARLKASPKDAELWAWRCHSVARGDWRPDGRQVCDKAVALSPDSAPIRLDRGFLALALGERQAAVRDFDTVARKDPASAPALFGRGLVEAMNGDQAASKADRHRALGLDPKIPDWIEATYRIGISDPYRNG